MRSLLSTSLCLALCLVACGGGSDEEPLAGPCVLTPQEPSLIISAVQNASTAAAIPVVTLSNINVAGSPYIYALLPREAFNVRVVGSSLECTAPCGFTTQEGAINFDVSAPGYVTKAITTAGTYSTRRDTGSCQVFLSGGSRVSIALAPLSP